MLCLNLKFRNKILPVVLFKICKTIEVKYINQVISNRNKKNPKVSLTAGSKLVKLTVM